MTRNDPHADDDRRTNGDPDDERTERSDRRTDGGRATSDGRTERGDRRTDGGRATNDRQRTDGGRATTEPTGGDRTADTGAQIYYEADADRSVLDSATVAVIGYGSQGHAHAQNLADSGIDVVVGLREGSSSRGAAREDGLRVTTPRVAAREADVVSMLVPDTVQPDVYDRIADELEPGDTLQFAHGFNVHYGQIEPAPDVDVTMVAPKGPGHILRRDYERGEGTPGLLAVYRDTTGDARRRALAYASAIGCTRAGVVETTFREETETDLFGEQAVLCGGVTELIHAGFETLTDAGYSPEMAYFECLNELKLIVDLLYEGGTTKMWDSVSDTAEYGGLTRGDRVIDDHVRDRMEELLEEVQNGEFAREWITENDAGRPAYRQHRRAHRTHEIERVGDELRDLFAWSDTDDADHDSTTDDGTDDHETTTDDGGGDHETAGDGTDDRETTTDGTDDGETTDERRPATAADDGGD